MKGVIDYYFSYIKFDKEVRRSIYTTNGIENLNRYNKVTKNLQKKILNFIK